MRTETRSPVRLADLVAKHAGGYFEPEIGADGKPIIDLAILRQWLTENLALNKRAGVYILWRQAGYCAVHEQEHLQAQYVGKSGTDAAGRIAVHQAKKAIGDGNLPPEISFIPCINRKAKYLEQLLLDNFHFPQNFAENAGQQPLCYHISPAEWN
jgi:hypothetical protein